MATEMVHTTIAIYQQQQPYSHGIQYWLTVARRSNGN